VHKLNHRPKQTYLNVNLSCFGIVRRGHGADQVAKPTSLIVIIKYEYTTVHKNIEQHFHAQEAADFKPEIATFQFLTSLRTQAL